MITDLISHINIFKDVCGAFMHYNTHFWWGNAEQNTSEENKETVSAHFPCVCVCVCVSRVEGDVRCD